MKYIIYITGISLLLFITGCEKYWDEHFGEQPETVNMNMWDVLQSESNLTSYVQFMKDFKYDTLFMKDNGYTLFIPDNDAFSQYLDTGQVVTAILDYLISDHVIQSGTIKGKRKIQTMGKKFALLERNSISFLMDGVPLDYESPLFVNGKYYIMDELALPKPNIYEYYAINNPIFKDYIDSQDSIILDREKSVPIGFDEFGNTIYDTVSDIYNEFEEKFFPVREEFRNQTATVVFPKTDDYNNALTELAQSIGRNDFNDIPLEWQHEVLIPYLMTYGVFENMVEQHEFIKTDPEDTLKLKNILGDSIIIDYMPDEKAICSNGYAYNYSDFTVPDTLVSGATRLEAEWLTEEAGVNKWVWHEAIDVKSTVSAEPIQELIKSSIYTASNDTLVRVMFTKGYTGEYSVEFNAYSFHSENLLPRKYLMVVMTHMDVGGIYKIYVNDELVTTFDYYTFVRLKGLNWSVTGKRYINKGRFNKFDCFVDNITDYGTAKIRFEYAGPSTYVLSNGLAIDYIEFIPYND